MVEKESIGVRSLSREEVKLDHVFVRGKRRESKADRGVRQRFEYPLKSFFL